MSREEEKGLTTPAQTAETLILERPQELLGLLEVEIQRFTMGESTSVRSETAQDIAHSIAFSIGQYYMLRPEDQGLPLAEALRRGRMLLGEQVKAGRALLDRARQTAWRAGNRSYRDTMTELALFFRRYDLWHRAHEVPCMIDYQLLRPVETGQGILFICAYLERLIWENLFCRSFDSQLLLRLYDAWMPGHRELLVNLCEPVLCNSLGRMLAEKEPEGLCLEGSDMEKVSRRLYSLKPEEIAALLENKARRLCRLIELPEPAWDYFCAAARDVAVRLGAVKGRQGMDGLFVRFS